ncbi:hypothetical protein [Winogradskyella sp.]|uniref:hypothetical protein n=1 Tax=Winogradskyella sp. TaxID=1883156 RepID=UPI003AB8CC6B
MKKELTRKQMIALIASDYGFGPERTEELTTQILKEVCDSSQPYAYLSGLLANPSPDMYI